MNRLVARAGLLAGLLLAPACIQRETTHTWYLSPGGEVTWMTIERDIRSDEREPDDRYREEQEVVDRLAAGEHPVQVALRRLGADSVRVRVLRRERPYAVMTEGRFARADQMIQRLLDDMRLPGSAVISGEGHETTLEIVMDAPSDESESGEESPVDALTDCDAPYRFVLTEGRFVAATGFTLEGDGTIARLDERILEGLHDADVPVRLSLTWAVTSQPGA
jgi:PAS domain-containing protein